MKAGWSEWTDFNNHLIIAQPGFNVLGTSYPDGWYSTTFLKERRYDGGVDIKWAGLEGHKMLVNLSRSNSTIVDAWKETNVDPLTYAQSPSMQRYDGVADSIPVNNSRNITSAAIQDEIALQEDVALTATVRTDSYSDIGATVNPRLAVVWNLAEGHLLKAQYATAFRPPTIYETSLTAAIAPGASLYPETVTTDDIAYIYRSPDFMFGMDLFLSDMKNLIRNYGYQYVNDNGAQTRGVEVEVEKLVGASFKVCGNVSYADTKDQITGSPVQDSTRWLANISAMWKPVYDFSITGRYRMAGERQRYAHDTREALPGYDTLDITASYYNLLFKGLTLRGGVKNAFDKTVKYPGMVAVMGNNVLPLQPDDMQTDGRKLWVTLEYELGK
jgi:iron complex outermembrane receptor protein